MERVGTLTLHLLGEMERVGTLTLHLLREMERVGTLTLHLLREMEHQRTQTFYSCFLGTFLNVVNDTPNLLAIRCKLLWDSQPNFLATLSRL